MRSNENESTEREIERTLIEQLQRKAPLKVLVADDEKVVRTVIAVFLREVGFFTIHAQNGKELVELARTELPGIILSDVEMPILTGTVAVSMIRKDPKHPSFEVPVIMMSGTASEEECLQCGASIFFQKPVTPLKLWRSLSLLLR
jgi:CheY-like chemotaxis protein